MKPPVRPFDIDLDSFVSSISLALFLSSFDTLFTPVISIPRSQFSLRTDIDFLIKFIYPDSSFIHDLIFSDEIDFNNVKEIILTDHNKLTPSLQHLNHLVTRVFDHHKDEGLYKEADPRIIVEIGSATTLIAELWFNSQKEINCQFAMFLLAPILMDTVNLEPSYKRVTPRDQKMAEFLIDIIKNTNSDFDYKKFYADLEDAKSNITHLSSELLLVKDYKEWVLDSCKLGISSVGWNINGGWLKRDGENFSHSLREYKNANNLDVLIIMTAFDHSKLDSNREFEREILFCVDGDYKSIIPMLECNSELDLEIVDSSLNLYNQRKLSSSRKQVYPIVEEALKKLSNRF